MEFRPINVEIETQTRFARYCKANGLTVGRWAGIILKQWLDEMELEDQKSHEQPKKLSEKEKLTV